MTCPAIAIHQTLKKAFFVLGPESSGTRMMTRALILSGCYENERLKDCREYNVDFGHELQDRPDLLVFHRSLPHQKIWPDLAYARSEFEAHGYQVIPVFMTRDINATIRSQIRRRFVENEIEAFENIRRAYRICCAIDDFIPVTYEAFCCFEEFRKWLFKECFELPETTIQIWEGNSQYYDEE